MYYKYILNQLIRLIKIIYFLCVIISIIVISLYIICTVFIKPPKVNEYIPSTNVSTSYEPSPGESANDIPKTTYGAKGRQELVYTFLVVASDQSGLLADVIMVIKYDTINQTVGMVSIPRDTLVNPNDIATYPKINSSYRGEPSKLKTIIEDMLGIPIDYYFTVDTKGFIELIDSIDGIYFDVPVHMSYDDPIQNLSIHYEPGLQYLTGQQALEVCRLRYNQDGILAYPDYDIGRTRTQRNLLLAVAKKVLSHPDKIMSYLEIWKKYIKTDLEWTSILWFANTALNLDLENSIIHTALSGDGNVTCKGVRYCYQLYPEKTLEVVNEYLNPYINDLSLSDLNIYEVTKNS